VVRAIDGASLTIRRGEIYGLVGESGSGKSVTALSVLRLIDPPGKVVAGEIRFDGQDLSELSERSMRDLRGSRISMIFQEAHSSLNPVFTIGRQVAEAFRIHQGMGKRRAWQESVELLRSVGIPNAEQRAHAYPHEISGGQAQRVMIAMAVALDPELLIADEPTTALDVTIQAQILDLLQDLAQSRNTAILLITHDLGIVSDLCERVSVMYAGEIVEEASAKELFQNPCHPYTQGLIASIPALGNMPERLSTIPGTVPRLSNRPPGCRFAPRCAARIEHDLEQCTQFDPAMIEVDTGHSVRCWLYEA
jgi:oligopeptide/dipeptide ABC transporter ATP-binding protein